MFQQLLMQQQHDVVISKIYVCWMLGCTFLVQYETGSSTAATQVAKTLLAQSKILGTEASSPLWQCQSCLVASICCPILHTTSHINTTQMSRHLLSSSLKWYDTVVLCMLVWTLTEDSAGRVLSCSHVATYLECCHKACQVSFDHILSIGDPHWGRALQHDQV